MDVFRAILKGKTVLRSTVSITLALFSAFGSMALAEQTPPIMPKIQDTPLPPAVVLPGPPTVPADVPNRPLTAAEAVHIALCHQPSITVAGAGVTAAQGRQQQAKSDLLPNVVLSTGYNHINGINNPVGITTGTGFTAAATVNQLVFDFNHTRDIVRQSQALTRSANANLTRVQSDLVLQVKQAFYVYGQNLRLVDVNAANVKNQQNHLALAEARLNAGVGLPADVVRAQTAVSNAIFNLNVARNNASVSRVTLALLMGIDPRTPVEVADDTEPEINANDTDALVNQALKCRPEVIQAQANVNAASYGVSAAKTGNAPILSTSAGIVQKDSNFPPNSGSLTVGVSIVWAAFDAGFTAGRVKEANANLVASQAQLQSTQLAVVSDVSQAYLNLKTAEQRVATADAEVANAEESVRLITGRYQAGLGTFLDVLDAQTALVTARTNRVNAVSAVNQARAALAHAVGASV